MNQGAVQIFYFQSTQKYAVDCTAGYKSAKKSQCSMETAIIRELSFKYLIEHTDVHVRIF